MTYIRKEAYAAERQRPKLLTHYLEQMTQYLRLQHPTATPEVIESFVKNVIRERFKAPEVEAIVHKREGHSEVVKMKLDTYVRTVIKDNNLSPSGTCYMPVSRKESFLRMSIEEKVAARNAFKKRYLDAESRGDKRESQYYNQNQANAKIFNNAIAGGMRIKQFILGDKAGFGAITSVGRLCVKQGYSFIERAVNGNLYLPSMRDAITYVFNHVRHVPESFVTLITEKTLYVPTVEEVVQYILSSVANYVSHPQNDKLLPIITNLTEVERSYVFYAGCFNNLCRYNEDLARTWIDSCFVHDQIDPGLTQDINIDEIKTFKGDVVSCILSTNYKLLGENPDKPGKWNSTKDAAIYNPQGLKEFIYCCRVFVANFERLVHILQPILQIKVSFSRMVFQDQMARYTVPLSDTDSNIFSTQELIRWKRGKLDFSQESYQMNALVTFILSQSLEHVFAQLSAGFGAEGKDVFRISMKNEFLYPILLATALGKHYIAIATMQEGSYLPNPRKDIKGIGLRSSAYPKLVRDTFDAFVVELFATIEKAEPIRAGTILKHVADLEQVIYTSVTNQESDYLQTTSVKRKEDYAEPMGSAYFYYELWTKVFADDYGEMVIPNKCYKIPLKGGKKLFRNPEFLEKLKETSPDIHDRLVAFMANHPKRDISAILIPPFKGKTLPFFLEIMDIRSHISQIMMGYYHVLNALGIGTVSPNVDGLVSDFFDPSTALLE